VLLCTTFLPTLSARSSTAAPEASAPVLPEGALNATILALIEEYMAAPSPPYVWLRGQHTEGVTRPLRWQGALLAQPDPGEGAGVHCSGITFELYVRALREVRGETALSPDALRALKDAWYIRDDVVQDGLVGALASRGLGEPVGFAELLPGDLVQFWRNSGNGHSAVFIEHTRDRSGALRGLVFWSAQRSSEGLGYRMVSFGQGVHQLPDEGSLFGVRAASLLPPPG